MGRRIQLVVEIALSLAILAVLAGALIGQPILVGYVDSGSMSPTLDPGDGFIALPMPLAGEISEGDIVVFDADQINNGGLTTHRVAGRSDRGYITRGDANPFPDQAGREPPVKEAQIVAKVWQLNGNVVVIPHLGTAVVALQDGLEGIQRWFAATFRTRSFLGPAGLAYLLFGLSVLAYIMDWKMSDGTDGKDRDRPRNRDSGTSMRWILIGMAALLVVSATAAMVVPGGTQEFGIISAEFESDTPTVIPQGTANDIQYAVPNAGLVPIHAYIQPASEGVGIRPRHVYVGSWTEAEVTLTLQAPPDTGYYRRYVAEYRYLALLPEPVIRELFELHPWAPIIAIDAMLGGGLYAVGLLVLGLVPGRIRDRSRPYTPSLTARIKGVLY